jgi:hypothetical protein
VFYLLLCFSFKKFIQMKRKLYKREEIIKRLEELGLTNIDLSYKKGEGWWLTCDTFDDWISMDSYGAMIAVERLFNKS